MGTPSWLDDWIRWKIEGGVRPKSAPRFIPLWAWDALKREKRWRALSFWRSKGIWTAWGFENHSLGSINEFFGRAAEDGYKWVGVQTTPYNNTKADLFRVAANLRGVKLVIWEWAKDANIALTNITRYKPDAYVANVEHVGDWDAFTKELRKACPDMPMGVFTNFAGTLATPQGTYDKTLADPWVKRNFAWITEAYMVNEQGPQPSLSPGNLDWTARTHGGVPETFPAYGIYRTGPESYKSFMKEFPYYSWYLAEYHPDYVWK